MVDILIPLGNGSIWDDNNELKYALRSVELHLKGISRIILIGQKPKWIKNITHLPFEDKRGHEWRDLNIFNKIIAGIENISDLSESFLFMNDDHFILKSFNGQDFPFFYRELDMIDTINMAQKNHAWQTCIRNTRKFLLKNGFKTKMFDTHTPILYNKYKFQSLQSIDWSIPYGYGIKSLYANSNNIEGILMKDGKLFASETKKERIFRKISELPCFSTSPIIPMAQREIIQSLYEKKSIFEK